jgi:hypothetical protein
MNDERMSFVVSVGHAEYMVREVQNIEHSMVVSSIQDATVEVLRAVIAGDFSDVAGWNDAVVDDSIVTVNGDDYDVQWEDFVHWYGPREFIEEQLMLLMDDVMEGPTGGDDDTFDYWPSGVRYCEQVADQLGGIWPAKVRNAAKEAILTRRPEFKDELFNACRLDNE